MKKLIILSIMSACLMSLAQTNISAQVAAGTKKAIAGFTLSSGQNIWIVDAKVAETQALIKQELAKQELSGLAAEKPTSGKDLDLKKIDFGWQPEVSALVSSVRGYLHLFAGEQNCSAATIASHMQSVPVEISNDLVIDISQLSEVTQTCLRK